jgi:hypothetical protein
MKKVNGEGIIKLLVQSVIEQVDRDHSVFVSDEGKNPVTTSELLRILEAKGFLMHKVPSGVFVTRDPGTLAEFKKIRKEKWYEKSEN